MAGEVWTALRVEIGVLHVGNDDTQDEQKRQPMENVQRAERPNYPWAVCFYEPNGRSQTTLELFRPS